jgi:hypothetical protein
VLANSATHAPTVAILLCGGMGSQRDLAESEPEGRSVPTSEGASPSVLTSRR